MAMLAEPRRKQKVINLRAKNNAWSNDSTKFGQRMLEKMGWTSGKGLGANENGITEHVVARYKNDEKGLGFEDKNDQWTKHEDDFNALLANLSNTSDNTENLHSGISLEDKSKKSKARIHYHKFTRGKDISRYSEKDLANIFGKKSFKDAPEVPAEPLKEDLKMTEQVFTEKGSMEDYFKNKLAAFKSKSNVNIQQNDDDEYEPGYAFRGFSQETDRENTSDGLEFKSQDQNCTDGAYNNQCALENIKKKKKLKDLVQDNQNKCEQNNEFSGEKQFNSHNGDCIDEFNNDKCNVENVTKKRKSKNNSYLSQEIQEKCDQTNENMGKKKKKKLKNTNDSLHLVAETQSEYSVECHTDEITSKKNKSKKKQIEPSNNEIIIGDLKVEEEKVNKKKKKSKNKEHSTGEAGIDNQENSDYCKRKSEVVVETQVPKKKKKKKIKD